MNSFDLYSLAYNSIFALATTAGINASGRDDAFGCIFGRDSAITILMILKACSKKKDSQLLEICKRTLKTLINLQGTQFNLESGEEPGKFIHEFRRDKYEHLLKIEKPWYIYEDKTLRNYDSLDSTPLNLIAIYKYWALTKDGKFLIEALPAVEAGLNWIISFGDKDKDHFLEYEFRKERHHGGSLIQSWTDSSETLLQPNGKLVKFPVAPVEVQGYAWLALKLWGYFYAEQSPSFGQKLILQSASLKKAFNEKFIIESEGIHFAAQALDGNKNQIKTITGNPLILLWATFHFNKPECILEDQYVEDFVARGFMKDLFEPAAGVRTMSTKALGFRPGNDSYHNGSFWPVLNGLIYEGLINWHYLEQAEKLKQASLKPLNFFKTPIELYFIDQKGNYLEFKSSKNRPREAEKKLSPASQTGSKTQAWTAAAMLEMLA